MNEESKMVVDRLKIEEKLILEQLHHIQETIKMFGGKPDQNFSKQPPWPPAVEAPKPELRLKSETKTSRTGPHNSEAVPLDRTTEKSLQRYYKILEILEAEAGVGKHPMTMNELGEKIGLSGASTSITVGHIISYLDKRGVDPSTCLVRKMTSMGIGWNSMAKITDAMMFIQGKLEDFK